MTNLDLSSVRAKIDRAAKHLECLDELISSNIEVGFKLRYEYDPLQGKWKVIYDSGGFEFDPELGAIYGDFIHNTRSALDHLVCALVRANRVKVRKYHHYPLCSTPQQFRSDVSSRDPDREGFSCLHGLTPEQMGIISLHQPYVGRNVRRARQSALFLLHLAWNIDKHRRIHAVNTSTAMAPEISISPSPPLGSGGSNRKSRSAVRWNQRHCWLSWGSTRSSARPTTFTQR